HLDLLKQALLGGKIAAYAQGFEVMAAASRSYGWSLPLAELARIWRAGCIIRSQFLTTIASEFEKTDQPRNLLMLKEFIDMMGAAQRSMRTLIADCARMGIPMPALSASLSYFDLYRQGRGTANL